MAEKAYIDGNGLSHAWLQIKAYITSIINGLADVYQPKGTYLTEHQDISGKQNVIDDLATIRSGAAAGATAYQKKSDGIPKSDLSTAVQASLDKAETALQAHQDISGKVDKVTGMGLSSNDYTNAEKTKLGGIAEGAEVNAIESISTSQGTSGIQLSLNAQKQLSVDIQGGTIANNNSNFVTGGTVYTTTNALAPKASPAFTGTPTAPTANAGTNSTQIATTAFVTSAVSTAIASVPGSSTVTDLQTRVGNLETSVGALQGIEYKVESALPATGNAKYIYLVPNSGTGTNIYDEYLWISSSSKFERFGTLDIDLSGYVLASDLVPLTNAEIDEIIV